MWCGPFERYIWLDSDAIIWGDIVSALNWQDNEDYIVFWPTLQEAAHKSWLTHYYFDIELLQLYDPQFQWEWNPYFSAGAFACRRGAIPFDEWLNCESWLLEYPKIFAFWDQGIHNYLAFSLNQRGKLKLGQQDLQWIPEHRGVRETMRKFNPQGWQLPAQVESPYILHFCGKKPYIYDPRSYSKPFSLARLQHYRYKLPGKLFSQIKNIAQEEMNIVLSKVKQKLSSGG
jgi:lipopolysaccharide biosynthesis glycosyltransferase